MKTVRFLFNDEMSRAIVSGRKTVTRRPVISRANGPVINDEHVRDQDGYADGTVRAVFQRGDELMGVAFPCAPGDILIGRECWGSGDRFYQIHETEHPGVVVYRADKSGRYADDTPLPKRDTDSFKWSMQKWRPSIHMPDWAARIRRRVVSVTVERLHDITEDDAVREGFHGHPMFAVTARDEFESAWNFIYAAKGLGWDVNPWAWRIEFERENVQEVSNGR